MSENETRAVLLVRNLGTALREKFDARVVYDSTYRTIVKKYKPKEQVPVEEVKTLGAALEASNEKDRTVDVLIEEIEDLAMEMSK